MNLDSNFDLYFFIYLLILIFKMYALLFINYFKITSY